MENMTISDYLALEGRGHCRGAATTGIGLAAGLGGGALLLALAGLWGLNQASKARNAGTLAGIAANTASLGALNNRINQEHAARENWQIANSPSIRNYVDVSNTPVAASQSSANAIADAVALAAAINNNTGINQAVSHDAFLRVARYSAPQPCGCDTCCSCN